MTGHKGKRHVVPSPRRNVGAREAGHEHRRPIVRALSIPTAHASREAWPRR